MSSSEIGAVLVVTAGLVIMSLVGFALGSDRANHSILEQCRKTNNVYACKIIAVPEEPKP